MEIGRKATKREKEHEGPGERKWIVWGERNNREGKERWGSKGRKVEGTERKEKSRNGKAMKPEALGNMERNRKK